jgi:hypothetical protein
MEPSSARNEVELIVDSTLRISVVLPLTLTLHVRWELVALVAVGVGF